MGNQTSNPAHSQTNDESNKNSQSFQSPTATNYQFNSNNAAFEVSQIDTSNKVQNLTFGASQSGIKNTSESVKMDYQQSPQKIINQQEFEYWRQKGNELAVEALQNSDKLSWPQFKSKLISALNFYKKTPCLSMIYTNVGLANSQDEVINQKYNFEQRMSLLAKLNNQQFQDKQFNYLEEILRVSKNKSVCYRALIQNMYIQMQNNMDGHFDQFNNEQPASTDELMKELLDYFLCFTENLNLNLLYIIDQLGQDPVTKEIGINFKNKSSNVDQSPLSNDAGPGGSPQTYQGVNSFQNTDSMSQSINQMPDIFKLKMLNSQRFCEILQSCQFIFQDKFIKNVLSNEINLSKKIKFLEMIYQSINENNYDFLRKTCFYLAKIYYKKSCLSQNDKNIQASLHENQYAFLYLQRYKQFTQKIEDNYILTEANFLANDQKTNLHPQEIHKFQLRIENQQSMIRFLLSQTKGKVETAQSSSSKKKSPELVKSMFNGPMTLQNWKIRKYSPTNDKKEIYLNNSYDVNTQNKVQVQQRTCTPKVFSQKSISPHPASKKPLKKVITRRLSYYRRQQEQYQTQDMTEGKNNTNCFNACYSNNMQQNKGIQQRNNSPFSSMSCADPSNFAFSEGDVHRREKADFASENFGIMSDKQLMIKVKSITKKGRKQETQPDQTIGPFKVSSQNQNAMKLLEPKSACDGSIVSTILGEDEFTDNMRPKSIDDIKIPPSNQSNVPMTTETPSQIQPSDSRPSIKEQKEKNITKIIVKKSDALTVNNLENQNNMIVNLEVQNSKYLELQNSKQTPAYLRNNRKKKLSTQSNHSSKGKLVTLNQFQKMQREVNKLRLEKKLRQANHASYQQKMISERMRNKIMVKDQENALKNMHERQQKRLFPMRQSHNSTTHRKQINGITRQSMISSRMQNKVSTLDTTNGLHQKAMQSSRMASPTEQDTYRPSKREQLSEINKSIRGIRKTPTKQLRSPKTPDSLQDNAQLQNFVNDNPIQYSKPKVSRKKQLELKQRQPWRNAIGKFERNTKTARGKSSLSHNSERQQRMRSQSPRVLQRSVRKKRSQLRNKLRDLNNMQNNQLKSEFKVYAKNIYQTQKQVVKRKIEIQEQLEKQPIDIQIDVERNNYNSGSVKSNNEDTEQINDEGQSTLREPINTTREQVKNDHLLVPTQKKERKTRKKRLTDFQNNLATTKNQNQNNQSDRESRMIRNISNNIEKLNKRLNQAIQNPQNQTAKSKKDQIKKKRAQEKQFQSSRGNEQYYEKNSELSNSKTQKKLGTDQSHESKYTGKQNKLQNAKKQEKRSNDEQQVDKHNMSDMKSANQQNNSTLVDYKDENAAQNQIPNEQDSSQALLPKEKEVLKRQADANTKLKKAANKTSSNKSNIKQKASNQTNQNEKKDNNKKQSKMLNEHDFEPLRKLGRGSFGDVYLVRHVTDSQKPGAIYAMKTLSKKNNLEDSWIRYVKTERDVLAYSNNPYIVKLKYAFQTRKKLFLIIDFCPGGDLETLLSNENGPLDLEKAKFYIAEILLALRDLHARNIIYRDLKPDNVVIDNDGHAQLIDFGMAKQHISEVQKGAKTFCGSVKYLAPEMLKKMGHGQALDWYLLGVLLYEMVVGVTPYFSSDKDVLFNNILYGKLKLPKGIDYDVKSLLISLLNRNPNKRLGSVAGDKGALEIMSHPFFNSIDWQALMSRQNTGQFSFWPKSPKYTIDDYQEAFPQSQLTNEQIYQIYYGDDNENEEDVEDSSQGSDDDQANTKIQKKKKNGSQYYVYIDGWDFNRDLEPFLDEQMEIKNKNLLAAIQLLKQQQKQQQQDEEDEAQEVHVESQNNQNQERDANGVTNQMQTSVSANGDMAPPIEYKPSIQLQDPQNDEVEQN